MTLISGAPYCLISEYGEAYCIILTLLMELSLNFLIKNFFTCYLYIYCEPATWRQNQYCNQATTWDHITPELCFYTFNDFFIHYYSTISGIASLLFQIGIQGFNCRGFLLSTYHFYTEHGALSQLKLLLNLKTQLVISFLTIWRIYFTVLMTG